EQRARRRGAVEAADRVQDAGRAVDAEAALAGAHAEPQAAPDVVEVRAAVVAHRLFEALAADQLALADQLLLLHPRLAAAQARADPVVLAVLVAGQRLLGRAARPLDAELPAHRVDDVLRHQAQRRHLAPGHREQAGDAVALAVVHNRVRAADVARVGCGRPRLLVLEQWPRARPDPQRPGAAQ